MDMTMSSATPTRVEVVTSVQRRRRWTPEQKLEIVKQTNEPGSYRSDRSSTASTRCEEAGAVVCHNSGLRNQLQKVK